MRYLLIFLTIKTFLFANNYELKLYEKVFTSLFHKKTINLFVDKNREKFQNSKILKLTSCKDADIILLYNLKDSHCNNKPIFTTSYLDFIHSDSIGAFYWRKGRPQLKLDKKMILFYHLYIDKSLKKYLK